MMPSAGRKGDVPQEFVRISMTHAAGLPCRFPGRCGFKARVWPANDLGVLKAAGRKRDRHERTVHAYVHVLTTYVGPLPEKMQ